MKPASIDRCPRQVPPRAEHETRKQSADRAGERQGEGAGGLQQRLLQDHGSDAGPGRHLASPQFVRHAWARGDGTRQDREWRRA